MEYDKEKREIFLGRELNETPNHSKLWGINETQIDLSAVASYWVLTQNGNKK